MPRCLRFIAAVVICLLPTQAFAQTLVRVTTNGATLWRPGFGSVLTVVSQDTELEVVGRQGDWLEVVVPAGSSQERRTGLISMKQVTLTAGTLPADGTASAPTRPALARPGALQLPGQPSAARPAGPRDTGLRAFGDVSFHLFNAHDTFKAVLDQTGGVFAGGGGEFRMGNGLFVQGAVRFFRRTGERVFVFEDEVFPLGIDDTITIVPMTATAGFRFRGTGAIPYVGGGLGIYRVKETSDFEDPTERIDDEFTSYHVLGGAEWRTQSWLAVAFEVQYTFVPDALAGGLADIYDEHDLGGLDFRVKLVLGR